MSWLKRLRGNRMEVWVRRLSVAISSNGQVALGGFCHSSFLLHLVLLVSREPFFGGSCHFLAEALLRCLQPATCSPTCEPARGREKGGREMISKGRKRKRLLCWMLLDAAAGWCEVWGHPAETAERCPASASTGAQQGKEKEEKHLHREGNFRVTNTHEGLMDYLR